MPNTSALPTAMQDRRKEMEEKDKPKEDNVAPIKPEQPKETASAEPEKGAKVTISRDEFNELQAAAGRARAAEGRAESLRDDLDALTKRLTDLEKSPKSISQAPASPESKFQPKQITYSEQEEEEYGESKPFVRKVVLEVLNEEFPQLVQTINSQIEKVQAVAEGASKTAAHVKTASYTDRVREKVGNFDECVNHKYWSDFTQSIDPDTGDTWADLITRNFNNENVTGMVRVFNKFKQQYKVGTEEQAVGYEGGMPTSGDAPTEPTPKGPEILPFSARKEAHRKFINQEISFEEYSKIKESFDKADREGRIDYDK